MLNLKPKFYLFILLFNASYLLAQPAPPESANRTPLPGLVILAAAGAAYGARKTALKRKSKEGE